VYRNGRTTVGCRLAISSHAVGVITSHMALSFHDRGSTMLWITSRHAGQGI
jgi:hypothetical protein